MGRLYRRTAGGSALEPLTDDDVPQMDMTYWLEKAEAELRELGVTPRRP
jgi:hypothetical protein